MDVGKPLTQQFQVHRNPEELHRPLVDPKSLRFTDLQRPFMALGDAAVVAMAGEVHHCQAVSVPALVQQPFGDKRDPFPAAIGLCIDQTVEAPSAASVDSDAGEAAHAGVVEIIG